MEQADHTCFLYTLKPNDKEQGAVPGAPGYVHATDPNQLVPANISDQNYQCHLMQASNEQHVSVSIQPITILILYKLTCITETHASTLAYS